MSRILLIDDDLDALESLKRVLISREAEFYIETASNQQQALILLENFDPHVAVVDLCLDERKGVVSGFELLQSIVKRGRKCRSIVLTGHSALENGIRAINLGASHFLQKPPELDHLIALIKDSSGQAEMFRAFQPAASVQQELLCCELIGNSQEIEKLKDALIFASSNNQAVILLGETGVGKTLCASLIHRLSDRKKAKFICYSASYQNADLVNSELFGHLKGSFTGALESRTGLLNEADGGTFFIDEVDEIPKDTQVSLLKTLQNKTYRAVGSNKEEKSDFRLVCATNRDPEEAISKGKLREDFYFRIAHKRIFVPALRQRKSDIKLLAESFLQKLNEKEGVMVYALSEKSIDKLETYNWPGNIRELQAVVEGAAYLAQYKQRSEVLLEDIQLGFDNTTINPSENLGFHAQVEYFKRKLVEEAMQKTGENQVQAARLLGLDRSSLRRILGKE